MKLECENNRAFLLVTFSVSYKKIIVDWGWVSKINIWGILALLSFGNQFQSLVYFFSWFSRQKKGSPTWSSFYTHFPGCHHPDSGLCSFLLQLHPLNVAVGPAAELLGSWMTAVTGRLRVHCDLWTVSLSSSHLPGLPPLSGSSSWSTFWIAFLSLQMPPVVPRLLEQSLAKASWTRESDSTSSCTPKSPLGGWLVSSCSYILSEKLSLIPPEFLLSSIWPSSKHLGSDYWLMYVLSW